MKNIKNKKIIFSVVFFLLVVGVVFSFNQWQQYQEKKKIEENKKEAIVLVKKGDSLFDNATAESYNIREADSYYHKAYEINPDNERALYQLIRVHYVQGEFDGAFQYGEIYKQKYPNKKRVHYVLGLANAYAGNLDKSIQEFQEFIKSGESTSAGYLDIAWVYFKKGDYQKAKEYLEQGTEKFGHTIWLDLSLAMNKYNLDEDKAEVLALLKDAKKEADKLTPEIWKRNYSSNNPAGYQNDIQKIKDIIDIDIKIVKGEDISADVAKLARGLEIETLSPKGLPGGYTVSACCDSNQGKTCSSGYSVKNICNMMVMPKKGTIQCDGNCSQKKPSKPADNYCTHKLHWQEKQKTVDLTQGNCQDIVWEEWKVKKNGKRERKGVGSRLITNYKKTVVTEKSKIIPPKLEKPKNVTKGVIIDDYDQEVKVLEDLIDSNLRNDATASKNKNKISCTIIETDSPDPDPDPDPDPNPNPDPDPDPEPLCISGAWTPNLTADKICQGETQIQTNGCESRIVTGQKDCPELFCENHPTDPSCLPTPQEPIDTTLAWSTDRVNWNYDFDKLILLKHRKEKIYVKHFVEDGSCNNPAMPNMFNFSFLGGSKLKKIDFQTFGDLNSLLTFTGGDDVVVGEAFEQKINVKYCGTASDKNRTLHVKIVDIKEEEI